MKKLLRLAVLSILFLVSFAFFFCLFPSLVFILGGEFLAVLHHPAYVFFGGIIWSFVIAHSLYTEFDGNFFFKGKI